MSETFEEWRENTQVQRRGNTPVMNMNRAWNHQQKKIKELEGEVERVLKIGTDGIMSRDFKIEELTAQLELLTKCTGSVDFGRDYLCDKYKNYKCQGCKNKKTIGGRE